MFLLSDDNMSSVRKSPYITFFDSCKALWITLCLKGSLQIRLPCNYIDCNEHITPALQQLHWLPIKSRTDLKILLITWHHHISLNWSISTHPPALRSSYTIQLFAPSASLTTMGSRAFNRSAPSLWNSLPPDIRTSHTVSTFQSRLKTHLFRVAYSVSD